MSGPEFIVAIVAIGCFTGLIKKWMDNRYNNPEITSKNKLQELRDLFEQHKNEMQQRVQHLEAIVAEDEDETEPDYRQIEASSSDSTLKNDLQQKERV
ncbi:hypothetical protein [Fodinibius sp. SL11]|uniref:hypothetical protein n=1 Tax=Fodinibius sp. SL11 TaxID=3425690 RepID=UPI003F881802